MLNISDVVRSDRLLVRLGPSDKLITKSAITLEVGLRTFV